MIALLFPVVALIRPVSDPAESVYKLLVRSPTWIEWSGERDKTQDELVKTLRQIEAYSTEAIIRGGRRFVESADRAHFQRETLMYVVGRHIFNVPYGKLKEFPRKAESSPTGSFHCQPLAIDGSGQLGIQFRFGTYRGSGYFFRADFLRMEKQYGRRRKKSRGPSASEVLLLDRLP